jgi:hypothetical protein
MKIHTGPGSGHSNPDAFVAFPPITVSILNSRLATAMRVVTLPRTLTLKPTKEQAAIIPIRACLRRRGTERPHWVRPLLSAHGQEGRVFRRCTVAHASVQLSRSRGRPKPRPAHGSGALWHLHRREDAEYGTRGRGAMGRTRRRRLHGHGHAPVHAAEPGGV